METTLVAVYGTLRSGYGNHRWLKDSKFIAVGKTAGKHTMYASGIPFVVEEEPTSQIVVEVYDCTETVIKNSLDVLEGHPGSYNRRVTDIILENGETVKAWLYFYPGERLNNGWSLAKVESGDFADYRNMYVQT